MQYGYPLSERAIDILGNVMQPSKKEIHKQRSCHYMFGVGTEFSTLQEDLSLSIHQIRRALQKEIYGVVGIFFKNFEGSHSTSRVGKFSDDAGYNKAIDKIHNEGFSTAWSEGGVLYKFKSKLVSRQKGIYIPEQIKEDVEQAIDSEDNLFVGEISEDSLQVLEFILKRSEELREKHGNNWYPRFSDNSISRDTGLPLEEVKKSTHDLVGIIGESYQMVSRRVWGRRLFLPGSKFDTCRGLLT